MVKRGVNSWRAQYVLRGIILCVIIVYLALVLKDLKVVLPLWKILGEFWLSVLLGGVMLIVSVGLVLDIIISWKFYNRLKLKHKKKFKEINSPIFFWFWFGGEYRYSMMSQPAANDFCQDDDYMLRLIQTSRNLYMVEGLIVIVVGLYLIYMLLNK